MKLHDILLTVQYITISVLFVEVCIVFLRWKNSIHSYLILALFSTFLSNVGYLFQMKAGSLETYITALKFSYIGRVWIVFAFFLFSARMCRKKIPRVPLLLLVAVHIEIYISVLTLENHDLLYREYSFVPDPVPMFVKTNGIMHDLMLAMNLVLVVIAMRWIIIEYINEKNRTTKKRLLMLILAFGVQVLFFLLHIKGNFGFLRYYDVTMLGSLFGTVFMLIAILRYDLMGTREIAKDFAIDRISEGIIALDNAGRVQYYNEPAAKLFPEFNAFFRSEPLKDRNTRIKTPYDIVSIIDEAVKTGETLTINDRVYTPEENQLLYNGETYGKLYALVDDTEHYRYMTELQEQRDIADSANEAKSKFLANMSHEIRTPINAILGMDEMILRESEEKPIRAYASDIMSASRTLLSLINDILDLSKVEEGKMEIIPVQYDLSSLINDLVNLTRERAAKKGLGFTVNVDEHIPHLLVGDEIRIKQCATNILTNAVKYTETGEVTMSISHKKKDDDHILLEIKVEDTGIGMKEEDMENLFSPYKRIEEKRNRAIEGTGLGMSITRQLLDLMGSSLEVHSEYGKGSVFSFEVDQEVVKWEEIGDYSTRFEDTKEAPLGYRELFHAPEARILVVDDTEVNLTVIQNLLKKTRINIDTAISGKQALELAAVNKYDVMLIDHMMPEMDGIETLKHLRESGMNTEVPAVALTANAVSGAREMYLEAGFEDYLSKPVEGEKLEKMLYEMLPADKVMEPSDDVSSDAAGSEGAAHVSDGGEESSDPLSCIRDIEEIDYNSGLQSCGSEEGYQSVITVFHQTAKAKADEIEKYFREGDLENYTTKVHALKSSARIIGASALSEFAKNLEEAGKNRAMDVIKAKTGELLEMYRSLDKKLMGLDKEDESLPDIDPASLKEAYQTIVEIAGSMDYGMMDDILKDLKGYKLSEADKDVLNRIEGMLNSLDWDGIAAAAGERVKS